MTFEAATPPEAAATDDHVLATWLAEEAGRELRDVRGQGLEERELKDAGDVAGQPTYKCRQGQPTS